MIVAVLGSKGGSGKSVIAHLMSIGLARAGFKTAKVVMEQPDPRLLSKGFLTVTASDPGELRNHIARGSQAGADCFVIDGCSSRCERTLAAAELATLIVLPITPGDSDFYKAAVDVPVFRRRAPKTPLYMMRSRWPTNLSNRIADDKFVDQWMYGDSQVLYPMVPLASYLLKDHHWLNSLARRPKLDRRAELIASGLSSWVQTPKSLEDLFPRNRAGNMH
jgi:hypothetical protein